jgi:hypothetical protein
MKTQKSAVFAVLFAILAVFCFFTACEQEPEPKVASPNAQPRGGNYPSAQTVTLTTATGGAVIRYTLDGTDPTTASTVYSDAITISETTTLKAIAIKSGQKNSDVTTATYTFPENRIENINLGNMTAEGSGWRKLLDSIFTAQKYVNLDLSACTMSGTEFNPRGGSGDSYNGKRFIVSLILPNAATSIAAGGSGLMDRTFDGFANLQYIRGANITDIGTNSMSWTDGLQSVDFPKATTIGQSAFHACFDLQSVSFPQVATIDNYAFSGCSSLQSVDFPQVTTIGDGAFQDCFDLQSMNCPKVTSIGNRAFSFSSSSFSDAAAALVITMGSTAPTTLGYDIFSGIYNIRTAVTVKVPSSATGYSPFTGTTTVSVSGTNTDVNWANGFRGGSWNGSTWADTTFGGTYGINQYITLTIQQQQ